MGKRHTGGEWRYGDGIRRRFVWGTGYHRKRYGKQAEYGVGIRRRFTFGNRVPEEWETGRALGWNKKEVCVGNRVPEEIWETGRE